jgi:hypothetical protein
MGKIPIDDAKRIAVERRCPIVVVFGVDANGKSFNVTTYGMSSKLCKLAKSFGDQFAEAIFSGEVSAPQTEPDDEAET